MTPFFIWINKINHINTQTMGLNTIASVLNKRGQSYVDKLLNDEVGITEKLDTFRILFEKVNGEVKFFKKNDYTSWIEYYKDIFDAIDSGEIDIDDFME